jgi:D-aminopeptidase
MMKKQLILVSDMEGASGIFDSNETCMHHGTDLWRSYGKDQMTSDVLAVCEAANEFGIDEIFYYDGHFAGCPEHNVHLDLLPSNVIIPDTPDRCFYWRRIRGQAQLNPMGIITVGQHARNGEPNSYFPHTIQSPPISEILLNGIHIAEIGSAVLNFSGTPYVANIGCAASEKEAKELSPTVTHISVKSKLDNWEPTSKETYSMIKSGVLEALADLQNKTSPVFEPPYKFEMRLTSDFSFNSVKEISWKGTISEKHATWEAPDVEIGFEIFNYVRDLIVEKELG